MAKAGRKGWKEELNIAQRYADLTPKAFKVLKEMLESEEKADKKWAVEQLGKGFQKMIPQDLDITSGGEPIPLLGGITNGNHNNSDEEATETKEKD